MKEVYHSNGWTSHNEDNINCIFKVSTHVIIAKVDKKVIGFGRALSDGVYNAAIYDHKWPHYKHHQTMPCQNQ